MLKVVVSEMDEIVAWTKPAIAAKPKSLTGYMAEPNRVQRELGAITLNKLL